MAQGTLLNSQGTTILDRWLMVILCSTQLGRTASHMQEPALNIIRELKHETKAADVIIQFVLTLGNSATL